MKGRRVPRDGPGQQAGGPAAPRDGTAPAPARRGRRGSVRGRATAAATAVVAVALAATGLTVLVVLRAELTARADQDAAEAARSVAARIALGTACRDLELPDADDRPVQVVGEDGRLLAVGEDLERITGTGTSAVRVTGGAPDGPGGCGSGADTADDTADDSDADSDTDGDADGDADDEDSRSRPGRIDGDVVRTEGRAMVDGDRADYRFAGVEVDNGRDTTVWAGAQLDDRDDAVRSAGTVMLAGLPLLLLVVAGVTWLVTGRALRPVTAIRGELAAITASQDLARRVPEPASRDEIARLARATNETLAALETSVARQRRFVADASHELRSPIASLRTQLEVGAAHPDLLDLPGAVADTARLEQLAADLLLLARLDAGGTPGGRVRLDLAELVAEELSQRRGERVTVRHALSAAEVTGVRGQLARVLGNLLDNAQRHARTEVSVEVRTSAARAVLTVADDGAGVPPAERERIFGRFVRLDEARARDEGGAGLGLAIARDVAGQHGGTLTVGISAQGGALFVLSLPAASGRPPPAARGPGRNGQRPA